MTVRKTDSDKPRKGDTSRTSSQGRKLASGGNTDQDQKGDREINEENKSPIVEQKKSKPRARR